MKSQRDAVYEYVQLFTQDDGIEWSQDQDIKEVTDKDFQHKISTRITQDIIDGKVEMKNKKPDPKELRRYVVGMVNDAFRKDRRLNGDVKYEYKNPGSWTGSTNPVVKALRGLLKSTVDSTVRGRIQGEIDAEVAKTKKVVEVDLSVLPADMRARLGM